MQFQLNAHNPNALLRGTLQTLAEKFGGYKDGAVFLELVDDLIHETDPVLVDNALSAFRALVNRVEGATAAYQLDEEADTTLVADVPEDEHLVEDADITFVDPTTQADLDALFGAGPAQEPTVFYLRRGPEVMFRDNLDALDIRVPDFGPGSDLFEALTGRQAARTVPALERVAALDLGSQMALSLVFGDLTRMPAEALHEAVDILSASTAQAA